MREVELDRMVVLIVDAVHPELGALQPIADPGVVVGHAESQQHGVPHEHQAASGPQNPRRLG